MIFNLNNLLSQLGLSEDDFCSIEQGEWRDFGAFLVILGLSKYECVV